MPITGCHAIQTINEEKNNEQTPLQTHKETNKKKQATTQQQGGFGKLHYHKIVLPCE